MRAVSCSTFMFLLSVTHTSGKGQQIKSAASSKCDTQGPGAPINFSPLKLAAKPKCGTLGSKSFNNFNSGIDLKKIKTIYGFGDSYMSNGQSVGKTPPPACRDPNNMDPHYGGRAANGLVWIEQISNQLGATLKDYAQGGASISNALWRPVGKQTDMIGHVQTFLDQHNTIDASSTLAMISYGINDWAATNRVGTQNLPKAADELLRQTDRIIKAGITNVVVLSPPMTSKPLQDFDSRIWEGLKALQTQHTSLHFGYVDFTALYSAITANPQSFGYQHTTACLKSQTTLAGGCSDPDDYLYFIPGHPQKLTHGLMAEWTYDALNACTSS